MRYFLLFIGLCLAGIIHAGQYLDVPESNFPKKVLIFGVTGQDGTYLAEFLLNKNYQVHGVSRHATSTDIYPGHKYHNDHLCTHSQFFMHSGDVTNYSTVKELILTIQPDEIYNLAAQSNVKNSFENPEETSNINALGTLRILEAVRALGLQKKVRFFQAASGELYGKVNESPQNEETPFYPCSPYGVAKLYSYWIVVNYREAYDMFACNGILFNHESPLRGETFVTRKITLGACRYKLGLQDTLYLGNLDTKRDWGYAKDYVEAMWLMLQQDKPEDYVIATGEAHSVREFVELAFKKLDIDIEWHGKAVEEYGIDKKTGKIIVKIDPQFYRPLEVNAMLGQSLKAEKHLNWKPRTKFQDLLNILVEAEYALMTGQDRSI